MLTVEGNTIKITKGDTLMLRIDVQRDGEPYEPQEGDRIRFALKSKYTDPDCLILTEIPTDTMVLSIDAETMKTLAVTRTGYVYDIQLTDADGIVSTVVSDRLYTTEEVE